MAQVLFRYLCVTKGSSLVRPPHAFVVIKKDIVLFEVNIFINFEPQTAPQTR